MMNTIRITPREVFSLRGHITTDELNISHDIYELFMKNASTGDDTWNIMNAMATVYMAGYVSGVRTERANRRKKARISPVRRFEVVCFPTSFLFLQVRFPFCEGAFGHRQPLALPCNL